MPIGKFILIFVFFSHSFSRSKVRKAGNLWWQRKFKLSSKNAVIIKPKHTREQFLKCSREKSREKYLMFSAAFLLQDQSCHQFRYYAKNSTLRCLSHSVLVYDSIYWQRHGTRYQHRHGVPTHLCQLCVSTSKPTIQNVFFSPKGCAPPWVDFVPILRIRIYPISNSFLFL